MRERSSRIEGLSNIAGEELQFSDPRPPSSNGMSTWFHGGEGILDRVTNCLSAHLYGRMVSCLILGRTAKSVCVILLRIAAHP